MSSSYQNELANFHQFIGQQLASKHTNLSPEDALDLWREQNPCPDEDAETIAAIRESLANLEAGERGVTIEEFDREFRRRHNLDSGK
jgi:hypothetical protein